MTCKPTPNEFVDSMKNGVKGIMNAAGGGQGLAGLIAKGAGARIDGETYDASLKDYYEAINGPQLVRMAKLQKAINAGKAASGAYKYTKSGMSPGVDQAIDDLNRRIDEDRKTPDCRDPNDPGRSKQPKRPK